MKSQDIVTLSFYKELSPFKENNSVVLVQHIDSQALYVKKSLPAHNKSLYLTLQELQPPGTPKIHHALEQNTDTVIIIEDYINGKTLDTLLEEKHVFREAEALHIILQVCNSLLVLHSSDPPIIHRDIKPSNIIVSDELDATLIDFDASKQYTPDKKQDTILMGTLNYAAPEQFGFSQSDARTDIYALGILLNKMLTGFFPKDITYKGKVSNVIEKCIHMDPEKRYSSIEELTKVLLKHFVRAQKEFQKDVDDSSQKKWTLPGFRSNKLWKKAIAVPGYILFIFFAWLSTESGMEPFRAFLNQFGVFLWEMSILALCTNYHDFANILPVTRNSKLFVKIIGIFIWSFIFMILAFVLPDVIYKLLPF